ncbi:serine hydrolase FSH [Penicillium macrosclerotiorum]|uniref:serine hydrolase FSH n=1 Tax=Penicillium macrosclerotiorum TaxID=303699 RepID=UPI0025498EEF|nr:serine hydrolase FSH [Penicillium macrosclerotiorum]KAJ5692409.1 serine hydrolase FSH [Penicillium macrosclerotiorum]
MLAWCWNEQPDSYYRYYEQLSAPSMRAALYQLSKYIETEGPFDGVIGYSQGASLAATYLIQCSKLRSSERMPFKCAIFFSGGIPLDPMALESGDLKLITPKKTGALLTLPTTHIWGSNDEIWPGSSEILYEACEESQRNVSVHTEGHDIPGTRAKEAVQDAVRAIRRTLDRLPAGWGQ